MLALFKEKNDLSLFIFDTHASLDDKVHFLCDFVDSNYILAFGIHSQFELTDKCSANPLILDFLKYFPIIQDCAEHKVTNLHSESLWQVFKNHSIIYTSEILPHMSVILCDSLD